MIRKYFKRIMDQKVDMQERMFRLIATIGVMSLTLMLVCKLLIGETVINLLMLAFFIACTTAIGIISVKKNHVNAGSVIVAVLLLLFLPVNFVISGGMYGGAPVWFVFAFLYISLTLKGKHKAVFLIFGMVIVSLCYYIAFRYPNYMVQHTLADAYLDSALSVIFVSGLTCIMIQFQNHIYQEENRISNQQKKEIEELNKAENRFFSSMSHEIRTPINTIIGLNEMILRDSVSDEVAENARHIQGASKMLLTLINDILDLSKIESGKMDIINVSYETGVMFSEIINMIWIKAKEKGLEFNMDVDSSIPSMLCGDEVRIKQILINLLNNAIKYTKEGKVTLGVKCERTTLNRVRVYYSVKDTGQGVKKEDIPYLFDAFQRVDEEKNRHIEGTGLGLSIVKQLVDLMGGEISVNSVYTKGTTFLVMLEQDIIEEKELGVFSLETRVNAKSRTQYKQSFEAPKAQLLIVDDNEMNLMVAKKLLSDTKIQIDTASSGAECLKLTQNKHYDGILMDHLMPEMDGIECLHAIRAQQAGLCQDVPIIALTANAGSDNQVLYKKEGFNGYLAKPISGALLEAAVLNILPKELVLLGEDSPEFEIGKNVLMFDQLKRVPMMITTDSVSDLPQELLEQLNISVRPYYVCTDHGRFLDGKELETDALLAHIEEGRLCASKPPEAADYESFFAQKLTEARNIIHIAMAKYSSEGYQNACEAAKAFENVTVLDSGHLSSGMGIAALYAARMAAEAAEVTKIAQTVEGMRTRISTSFIVDSTETLYRSGRIPKNVVIICNALMLHPVITLRKSKMAVSGILMGSFAHVTRNYVRRTLKKTKMIDRRILFITYVGLDEKKLEFIQDLVQQYCPFERIYLQKASSSIASNCGPGTFGLMFVRKKNESW